MAAAKVPFIIPKPRVFVSYAVDLREFPPDQAEFLFNNPRMAAFWVSAWTLFPVVSVTLDATARVLFLTLVVGPIRNPPSQAEVVEAIRRGLERRWVKVVGEAR